MLHGSLKSTSILLAILLTIFTFSKDSLAELEAIRGECFGQNYIVVDGVAYNFLQRGLNSIDSSGYDYSHCKSYPVMYQLVHIRALCKDIDINALEKGAIFELQLRDESEKSSDRGGAFGEGIVGKVSDIGTCVEDDILLEASLSVPLVVQRKTAFKVELARDHSKRRIVLKKKEESAYLERVKEFTAQIKKCHECLYDHKEKQFFKSILVDGKIESVGSDECMECKIPEQSSMEKKGMIPQ